VAMTSTDSIRILVEVTTGAKPARPDTVEEADFRVTVKDQVREIEERGMIVDIPFEFPEDDA
jgi:hypothetical protein